MFVPLGLDDVFDLQRAEIDARGFFNINPKGKMAMREELVIKITISK